MFAWLLERLRALLYRPEPVLVRARIPVRVPPSRRPLRRRTIDL